MSVSRVATRDWLIYFEKRLGNCAESSELDVHAFNKSIKRCQVGDRDWEKCAYVWENPGHAPATVASDGTKQTMYYVSFLFSWSLFSDTVVFFCQLFQTTRKPVVSKQFKVQLKDFIQLRYLASGKLRVILLHVRFCPGRTMVGNLYVVINTDYVQKPSCSLKQFFKVSDEVEFHFT